MDNNNNNSNNNQLQKIDHSTTQEVERTPTGRVKRHRPPNLRMRKFTRYYFLFQGDQTKAAREAGYKQPSLSGCLLMKHPWVKSEIEKHANEHLAATGLNPYRVLEELRRLALSNVKDLHDENGNLLPISQLPDDVAASISSIEVEEGIAGTKKIKYRTHNKQEALNTALKYLELLPNKLEVSGQLATDAVEWFEYCTLDEKLIIREIAMKAMERMRG